MWKFLQKMKRVATTLSDQSKREYSDIFASVREFEAEIKAVEDQIIHNNSKENRSQLHYINVEYIKYLKIEESILKQKSKLQWFKEGNANTNYFHALIRGRRKRLFIHKICFGEDNWV